MASVQCDRCGITSEIARAFSKERKSFRNSTRTLCPNCKNKHAASLQKWLLFWNLLPGPIGLVFLGFNSTEGLGWVFLNLFWFEVCLILSILPHEWGHAFAARQVGWRVFKIYIGFFGQTFLKKTIFGFETEFRTIPLGGLVLAAPRTLEHYQTKKLIFILAGPLANLFLTGAAFIFVRYQSPWNLHMLGEHLCFLQIFIYANLIILAMNLWPRTIKTSSGNRPTDGRALLLNFRLNKKLQAESHAAWFVMEGEVCRGKSLFDEAHSWFEKGLILYPDNINLLNYYGIYVSDAAAQTNASRQSVALNEFAVRNPADDDGLIFHAEEIVDCPAA